MKGVEKIREGLYIKTDFTGTRIVYPVKNDDGSMNWFSFLTGGSWYNLAKTIIIILLILGLSLSYYRDMKACMVMMADPCKYCQEDFMKKITSLDENLTFNFSKLEVAENEQGG